MQGMKVKAISSQKKPLEVILSDLECLLQFGNQILKKGPGDKLKLLAQVEVLTPRISAFNQEGTSQLIVEPRTDSNIAIEIADPIPTTLLKIYICCSLIHPVVVHQELAFRMLKLQTQLNFIFIWRMPMDSHALKNKSSQYASIRLYEHKLRHKYPIKTTVITKSPTRGRHEVRVVVNGEEISGSPFQLL